MATFPIRCFTCGKVTANNLENYLKLTNNNTTNQKEALDELKYSRMCCRRMFLGYYDDSELLLYTLPKGDRKEIVAPIVSRIKTVETD